MELKGMSITLHCFINSQKLFGAEKSCFVHTRIDNTSLDDWLKINLGPTNRGYLKFLRPYVNTELQQTPNLSRDVKYNTSKIEMGITAVLR